MCRWPLLPFTLKVFYFGICEIATDDVSHTTSVIIYLKVATMLCHNLLQILECAATTFYLTRDNNPMATDCKFHQYQPAAMGW